jgi:hypothetical protein
MLEWEDEKVLIYLAGFVDGEGYLGVRTYAKQRNSARLSITNTDLGILLFIKHKLDMLEIVSSLSEVRRRIRGNRQRQWGLEVANLDGINKLCNLLLPYLIVKHRQAELLIRFTFLRTVEGRFGSTFKDEEAQIYEELKTLNKRGV